MAAVSARSIGAALALVVAVGPVAQAAPAATSGAPAPGSDKDKADAAAQAIAHMREQLSAVERKVEEARRERDVLRLNCVNERKSNVTALLRVAELALEELRAALRERQSEAVDHEYGRIMIARDKVDGYKSEAEQCIGLLAFYEGEETERQFIDENTYETARTDPTAPPPVEPPPFRPPAASPIR